MNFKKLKWLCKFLNLKLCCKFLLRFSKFFGFIHMQFNLKLIYGHLCAKYIFAWRQSNARNEKVLGETAKLELHLFCDASVISSVCAGSKSSQMLVADAGKGVPYPTQRVVSLFCCKPLSAHGMHKIQGRRASVFLFSVAAYNIYEHYGSCRIGVSRERENSERR